MQHLIPTSIADQSWRAIVVALALAAIGAVGLYSVADGSIEPWAGSHLVRFSFFLIVAVLISYISPDRYKLLLYPAYWISVALLLLVLVLGVVQGGARSWLNLGFMQIQPSELVKISLIAVLARFFEALPPKEFQGWGAVWPPVFLTIIPFALIAVQPDLGTATMLLLAVIIMTFLAGLPLRLYIWAGAGAALLLPLIYAFLLPHQQRRITIFFNPEADPLGAGYHIAQSYIAIGSGGFFGKGFLQGSQSHLQYLPATHTDFIFPAIAEEWGLVGALAILWLFGLLLSWGMRVSREATTRFEQLFAAGLTCSLFLYISINLLMVVGLAPVVGIPLPLVSHGGSAMLSIMLSLGLLMSVDRKNRARASRRPI